MEIIDISWPVSAATTGYKDKRIIQFNELKKFAADGVRESAFTLSAHSGTHVDAPAHFLADGKTIDQIPLDRFIGMCVVLDFTMLDDAITREHLLKHADALQSGEIVLLKTANSMQSPTTHFSPHFVYLHSSGAEYLAQKKIKTVGIDYLGIERSQPDHLTHTTLMHHDVGIVEGLRLGHVQPGRYEFYCLPLLLIGLEAAPARAILIK